MSQPADSLNSSSHLIQSHVAFVFIIHECMNSCSVPAFCGGARRDCEYFNTCRKPRFHRGAGCSLHSDFLLRRFLASRGVSLYVCQQSSQVGLHPFRCIISINVSHGFTEVYLQVYILIHIHSHICMLESGVTLRSV